jgi:hypothetical protein
MAKLWTIISQTAWLILQFFVFIWIVGLVARPFGNHPVLGLLIVPTVGIFLGVVGAGAATHILRWLLKQAAGLFRRKKAAADGARGQIRRDSGIGALSGQYTRKRAVSAEE